MQVPVSKYHMVQFMKSNQTTFKCSFSTSTTCEEKKHVQGVQFGPGKMEHSSVMTLTLLITSFLSESQHYFLVLLDQFHILGKKKLLDQLLSRFLLR
jgi:hypothetical protein